MKSETWNDAILAGHREHLRDDSAKLAFDALVRAAIASPNYLAGPAWHGDIRDFRYFAAASGEQPYAFIINRADLLFYVRSKGLRRVAGGFGALKRRFSSTAENSRGEWTIRLASKEDAERLISFLFTESIASQGSDGGIPNGIARDHGVGHGVDQSLKVQGRARHWWVNNGQSFEHEIAGNYVWCPKTNINGAPNWAFDNVALPVADDIVFAYAGGHIRAVGVVIGAATTAEQPSEFGKIGENRHRAGWRLPVAFAVLRTPLRPKEHMDTLASLLPEKYSPIRASGDGNQVAYFATVPPAMAAELRRLLSGQVEEIEAKHRPSHSVMSATTTDVDQSSEGILDREIFARTDIGPTQKQTLVNARRGQGLFRERVIQLEGRCRVTGVTLTDHLRAGHIKPWKDSSDFEKLDGNNGLLLSPHLDHLFDQGYISFSDFGDVIISPKCPSAVCMAWGIDETIDVGSFRLSQRPYLAYHRAQVLKQ